MYQQIKNKDFVLIDNIIRRTEDNACIPFDPDNTDYQAYLKWISEGNTPESAE